MSAKILTLLISLITMTTTAQFNPLKKVHRVYSDNSEFKISTENEIYHLKNIHSDGTEWKIEHQSIEFIIQQAYTGDMNEWKIYEDGKPSTTMYFKTVFENSFNEWRTGDNPNQFFYIKSISSDDFFDWKCTTAENGNFLMKADYNKDAIDWTIDDTLEASSKIKFSLVFAALISAMNN